MELITPWLKNNNPSSNVLQVYKGLMNFSITNKILHLRLNWTPPPPPTINQQVKKIQLKIKLLKANMVGWLNQKDNLWCRHALGAHLVFFISLPQEPIMFYLHTKHESSVKNVPCRRGVGAIGIKSWRIYINYETSNKSEQRPRSPT